MMTEPHNALYNNNEGRRPTNESFEHGSVDSRLQNDKVLATGLGTLLLFSISMPRDLLDPARRGSLPPNPSLWRR